MLIAFRIFAIIRKITLIPTKSDMALLFLNQNLTMFVSFSFFVYKYKFTGTPEKNEYKVHEHFNLLEHQVNENFELVSLQSDGPIWEQ